MPRAVRLLLAGAMLAAAGWLVMLYLTSGGEPSQDAPAPSQDLVLGADEARDRALDGPGGAQDPPLDERVLGDGGAGPHVRTDPAPAPEPGPWHVRAAAVGLDSPVTASAISDGYMEVPRDLRVSGWLSTTAPLGGAAEGSTLLAGHVTYSGERGAMYYIGLSEPGQVVRTWDEDGAETAWVVTQVRSYRKEALPAEIFQPDGVERQLNLVTCGGRLYRASNGYWYYDSNVVVTAVPLHPVETTDDAAATAAAPDEEG